MMPSNNNPAGFDKKEEEQDGAVVQEASGLMFLTKEADIKDEKDMEDLKMKESKDQQEIAGSGVQQPGARAAGGPSTATVAMNYALRDSKKQLQPPSPAALGGDLDQGTGGVDAGRPLAMPRLQSGQHLAPNPGAFRMSTSTGGGGGGGEEENNNDEENPPAPPATTLEALAVDDDVARIQEETRQQVFNEAVQAVVLPKEEEENATTTNNKKFVWLLLLLIALVALGLGLGLGRKETDSSSSSSSNEVGTPSSSSGETDNDVGAVEKNDNRTTIQIIQDRGYVKCGLGEFNDWNATTQELTDALGATYCRAMALFVLGDASKVEPVFVKSATRFALLQNKTIDVEMFGTTHTMERDVHQRSSEVGFAFTDPYFYSGLTVAGVPFFVDCAQNLNSFDNGCRDLRLCVGDGTTHQDTLAQILDGSVLVPGRVEGPHSWAQSLEDGKCNVVAAEPQALGRVRNNGIYKGPWVMATKFFSKEPLAVMTRDDDPDWTTMTNLVVNTFFVAELHNETSAAEFTTADDDAIDLAQQLVAGGGNNNTNQTAKAKSVTSSKDSDRQRIQNDLVALRLDLVSAFGHQGDLYKKALEPIIGPRVAGLNTLYGPDDTTGLLYSFPFGKEATTTSSAAPIANGTLDTVLQRGYLICGVLPTSRGPAFATATTSLSENNRNSTLWTGFDVAFCRAIAASLFTGNPNNIVFVEIENPIDSYNSLLDGEVDVVAGARVSLQVEYQEPTTGRGFSFSAPYYYNNANGDAYAFMTNKDDVQWSDLAFWVVHALIHAEEQGITYQTARKMPAITFFGEEMRQMFRDMIAAVGSYADIYNTTLAVSLPRSGTANRINEGLSGPQLFPTAVV